MNIFPRTSQLTKPALEPFPRSAAGSGGQAGIPHRSAAMIFLNKVKSVRPLGGFRVKLVFRDGYAAELDLGPICGSGPVFERLCDEPFFAQVAVAEWGVICWPNGADLDSDVLRYWCEQGRVCTREETDRYFAAAFAETGT